MSLGRWTSWALSKALSPLMPNPYPDESDVEEAQSDLEGSAGSDIEDNDGSRVEAEAEAEAEAEEKQSPAPSADPSLSSSSPKPSPYKYTQDVLAASELRYKRSLEKALDPEVFQVVKELPRDQFDRYPITPTDNKALATYKKLFNLLNDLQRFMGSLESIHFDAVNLRSRSAVGRATTVGREFVTTWWQGEGDTINTRITELLSDYFNLYYSIVAVEPYKVATAVSSLSAIFHTIQAIFKEILPESRIRERLTGNAFWSTYQNVTAECNKLLGDQPQKGILAALTKDKISFKDVFSMFITELAGTQASLDSLNSYGQCVSALDDINKLIDKFVKSKQNWSDKAALVYALAPAAAKLLKDFPQAYSALIEVFSTHLLEFAEQINLLLIDAFLGLNRLEVALLFKEGYLNSLGYSEIEDEQKILLSVIKKLNDFVESCGWKFKKNYKQALLEQLEEMKAKVPANTPEDIQQGISPEIQAQILSKRLLTRRHESARNSLEHYRLRSAQQTAAHSHTVFIQRKNALNSRIDALMAELRVKPNTWFSSTRKSQEKALLSAIQRQINKSQGSCSYYAVTIDPSSASQEELLHLLGEATDAYIKTSNNQLFYLLKNREGQVQVKQLSIVEVGPQRLKAVLGFGQKLELLQRCIKKALTAQQLQEITALTGHQRTARHTESPCSYYYLETLPNPDEQVELLSLLEGGSDGYVRTRNHFFYIEKNQHNWVEIRPLKTLPAQAERFKAVLGLGKETSESVFCITPKLSPYQLQAIELLTAHQRQVADHQQDCGYYYMESPLRESDHQELQFLLEGLEDAYIKAADQLFYVARDQGNRLQVSRLIINEVQAQQHFPQDEIKGLKQVLRFDESANEGPKCLAQTLTPQQLQAMALLTGHQRTQSISLPSFYNRHTLIEQLPGRWRKSKLLHQGEIGQLIDETRYLAVTREDSLSVIDAALKRLKDRERQGFWFFSYSRTRKLQGRINALVKLREWLLIPNYRLEDAFNKLRAKYSSLYNLLHKKDYSVINELKKIEQHIHLAGKKTFEGAKALDPVKLGRKQEIIAARLKEIDEEIREIKKSEEYWFPQWHTDTLYAHKKALRLLQQWLLKRGYELEDALRVFEFKYPNEYYYLMLEPKLRKAIIEVESPGVNKDADKPHHQVESLLEELRLSLNEKGHLNAKIERSAKAVLREGRNLKDKLDDSAFPVEEDMNALVKSLQYALRVVKSPQDQQAISNLRDNARNAAEGRSHFWRKFIGALGLLVVSAVACLALAGIPLLAGLSATAIYAGYASATLLSTASFGLFYSGCQKGLSRKMENLAEAAEQTSAVSHVDLKRQLVK